MGGLEVVAVDGQRKVAAAAGALARLRSWMSGAGSVR